MKFYIASGFENKEEVRTLAEMLTNNGWEWTYDWTHCTKDDNYQEIAVAEIDAIKNSDIVIVLLPGAEGTHIELGAAIACNKLVILVVDGDTMTTPAQNQPPAYFHPQISWAIKSSLPNLVQELKNLRAVIDLQTIKDMEKRVAELEAENKNLKELNLNLQLTVEHLRRENTDLQAELSD